MSTEQKPIVFTNDLDGVHFVAPPPLKTAMRLLKGNLKIPPEGEIPPDYKNVGKIGESIKLASHLVRPYRRDSLVGLEMFVDAAKANGRDMRVAILSGRQGALHALTIRQLKRTKRMDLFHDVYLNESDSSSGWKELTVRKLLDEGNTVVHIDDDLKPALRIARLDVERVFVYLVANISNSPRLLRRANIELPDNVIRVRDFREAGTDFSRRLGVGQI